MGRPCACCGQCECQVPSGCGPKLYLCPPGADERTNCKWCGPPASARYACPPGSAPGCKPGGVPTTLDGDAAWEWTRNSVPISVDADNDQIAFGGQVTPLVGDAYQFLPGLGGLMPGGLTKGAYYFVVAVTGRNAAVSATRGGAAIDLISGGPVRSSAIRAASASAEECTLVLSGESGAAVVSVPFLGFGHRNGVPFGVTFNGATNRVSPASGVPVWPIAAGQVWFFVADDDLPEEIIADAAYVAINVIGTSCQLALAAGGTPVTFGDGTASANLGFQWHKIEERGGAIVNGTFAIDPELPARMWVGFRGGPGLLFDSRQDNPWARCSIAIDGSVDNEVFCETQWDQSAAALTGPHYRVGLSAAAITTLEQGIFVDLSGTFGNSGGLVTQRVAYALPYSVTGEHYAVLGAEIIDGARPRAAALSGACGPPYIFDSVCRLLPFDPVPYPSGSGIPTVAARRVPDAVRISGISLERGTLTPGFGQDLEPLPMLPINGLEVELERVPSSEEDCAGVDGPRTERSFEAYDTGWIDTGVAGTYASNFIVFTGTWQERLSVAFPTGEDGVGVTYLLRLGPGALPFQEAQTPFSNLALFRCDPDAPIDVTEIGVCGTPTEFLFARLSGSNNGAGAFMLQEPDAITVEEA